MNLIIIILVIIVLILSSVVVYFMLNLKKMLKNKENEYLHQISQLEHTIVGFESEIKRQNFIIGNYQDKMKLQPQSSIAKQQQVQEQHKSENIEKIIIEKGELEREREMFHEKNKKLWEQSIAIHKEKERIDTLRREIESKHKDITDSIKYAQRIQNALSSVEENMKKCYADYFILYLPRNIVSGDFIWVKQLNNCFITIVADCTGHGVPGAFMSVLGIALLNEIVRLGETITPALILEQLRKKIISSLKQTDSARFTPHDGMDMSIILYYPELQKIVYAGANNSAYIIRSNELIELKPNRCPVGVYAKEIAFENREFEVQANDVFYLFSDGYADQTGGERGRKFLSSNFKQLLVNSLQQSENLTQQRDILLQTFTEWKEDKYHQIDDITVLGFRFN